MGYIKVSWPDNQKYSALTDEELELALNDLR